MPGVNKYPTVRLNSAHYEQLTEPYSLTVNAALTRYFWLLNAVTPQFSEAEWNLLRDACNGWATELEPPEILAGGLELQVEDAIELEALDKKWNVDRVALIKKLKDLPLCSTLATIHAVDQWWGQQGQNRSR